MARYIAEYRHDGRAWLVQFRDPDIATFGRSLSAARRQARSLLAVYLEVDDLEAAGIEVENVISLPQPVAAEVDRLVTRRAEAVALRGQVAEATRRAAGRLRGIGLSTRDVGEILGISGARVAQIERKSTLRHPVS
jgi:hypothetical protein